MRVQDVVLNKVKVVRYLGAHMEEGGELDREVERKAQAGWCKWRMAIGIFATSECQ